MTLRALLVLHAVPVLLTACADGGGGDDTDTDAGGTPVDGDVNTYVPDGYVPDAPVRLVYLGDSITAGAGASRQGLQYTALLQENDSARWAAYDAVSLAGLYGDGITEVIDVSVGGATTATMKRDQLPALRDALGDGAAAGETIVVFTIGGNDAQAALNPLSNPQTVIDTALSNMEAILDFLLDPSLFATPPHVYATNIYEPSSGVGQADACFFGIDYADSLPVLEQYNDDLRALGESLGVSIVDLRGHFLDHGVNAQDASLPNRDASDPTVWFADDCIHPNDRGHHELRRLFHGAIADEPLLVDKPGKP